MTVPKYEILSNIKKHVNKMRGRLKNGLSSLDPELVELFSDISDALDELAEEKWLVYSLEKLDLAPDDTVLVKMGDPETGWIPSDEAQQRLEELMKIAIPHIPPANILVWNYGVQVTKLSPVQRAELKEKLDKEDA